MTVAARLSVDEIAAYLQECPDEVCDLVLALRDVVLTTAPEAAEAIRFHCLCYYRADSPYGAIGGNICTMDGRSGIVRLGFIQGARLPDPAGLLQGDRKAKRWVDILSVRQARSRAIRELIRASAAKCATLSPVNRLSADLSALAGRRRYDSAIRLGGSKMASKDAAAGKGKRSGAKNKKAGRLAKQPTDNTRALSKKKAGKKARGKNAGNLQQGRQQGSQTGRQGFKSNSQEFFRHPGQGMRGKQGGQREAERNPSQESTGSDTRKRTRPPAER